MGLVAGTLAAQPRRQAMESSEDTTTSYDNRERRLSSSVRSPLPLKVKSKGKRRAQRPNKHDA